MPVEFFFLIISKMVFALVGLGIVVWGVLAYTRMRRSPVPATSDSRALAPVEDRLRQLEAATESIALQVERIAEGQRFVTKLLGDNSAEKARAEQQLKDHHGA